jgi:hypothetical protein
VQQQAQKKPAGNMKMSNPEKKAQQLKEQLLAHHHKITYRKPPE